MLQQINAVESGTINIAIPEDGPDAGVPRTAFDDVDPSDINVEDQPQQFLTERELEEARRRAEKEFSEMDVDRREGIGFDRVLKANIEDVAEENNVRRRAATELVTEDFLSEIGRSVQKEAISEAVSKGEVTPRELEQVRRGEKSLSEVGIPEVKKVEADVDTKKRNKTGDGEDALQRFGSLVRESDPRTQNLLNETRELKSQNIRDGEIGLVEDTLQNFLLGRSAKEGQNIGFETKGVSPDEANILFRSAADTRGTIEIAKRQRERGFEQRQSGRPVEGFARELGSEFVLGPVESFNFVAQGTQSLFTGSAGEFVDRTGDVLGRDLSTGRLGGALDLAGLTGLTSFSTRTSTSTRTRTGETTSFDDLQATGNRRSEFDLTPFRVRDRNVNVERTGDNVNIDFEGTPQRTLVGRVADEESPNLAPEERSSDLIPIPNESGDGLIFVSRNDPRVSQRTDIPTRRGEQQRLGNDEVRVIDRETGEDFNVGSERVQDLASSDRFDVVGRRPSLGSRLRSEFDARTRRSDLGESRSQRLSEQQTLTGEDLDGDSVLFASAVPVPPLRRRSTSVLDGSFDSSIRADRTTSVEGVGETRTRSDGLRSGFRTRGFDSALDTDTGLDRDVRSEEDTRLSSDVDTRLLADVDSDLRSDSRTDVDVRSDLESDTRLRSSLRSDSSFRRGFTRGRGDSGRGRRARRITRGFPRPSLGDLNGTSEDATFDVDVRRDGVFEDIDETSNLDKAFKLGKKEVRSGSEATFRVEANTPRLQRRVDNRKDRLAEKDEFRIGRDGGVVETRSFRISSQGELGDITEKGIRAIKSKDEGFGFDLRGRGGDRF